MFSRTKSLLNDIQACRTSFAGPSRGPAWARRAAHVCAASGATHSRRRGHAQCRSCDARPSPAAAGGGAGGPAQGGHVCAASGASHSRRGGHAQCRSRNAMSLSSRGRRSAAAAYTRAERRGPAPCPAAAVPLHVARRRRAAPCRPPCRRASDRSCGCRAAPSFEEEAQGARCASQPRAGLRAHVLLLARECHGRRAAPD